MSAIEAAPLLIERPEAGTLRVTGADRVTWLNGLVTCDLSGLGPGRAAWGLVVQKSGKILSEIDVVVASDALLVAAAPGTVRELGTTLELFLAMEDALVEDASDGWSWFELVGPRAAEILERAAREHGTAWGVLDRTGLGGAVVAAARASAQSVADSLREAGARTDDGAWERLRIEKLVPRFGVDFDQRDNAHEAALDRRCVSFDKGCYLGQEAVCMQEMRGRVKRRIVVLAIDGEPPRVGAELRSAAAGAVGELTSLARGPGDGAIALARVRADHASVGTALIAGDASARVVAAPPFAGER